MRIVLIAKPPKREQQAAELESIVARLRASGHDVRTRMTSARGDAELFARGAAHGGAELVLAVGGDGTINEVVNGLALASHRPRLGIVPAGTANDFARGLGLPRDAAGALTVALEGASVAVDLARVNRRYFINVSTGGFGADATRAAPVPVKRLLGPLAYLITGARRLLEFEPARAAFEVDGRPLYDGPFAFYAVGNSWRTGGGARVTPRAQHGDGALDVMIVGRVSRLDLLALLPDLRAGSHLESPDVLYVRANTVQVTAPEVLRVNADGEAVSARVLSYGVLRRHLEVMVPNAAP